LSLGEKKRINKELVHIGHKREYGRLTIRWVDRGEGRKKGSSKMDLKHEKVIRCWWVITKNTYEKRQTLDFPVVNTLQMGPFFFFRSHSMDCTALWNFFSFKPLIKSGEQWTNSSTRLSSLFNLFKPVPSVWAHQLIYISVTAPTPD
jgi:hypothetical protein